MSLYVPPRYVAPVKAGPVGPGAGVLMTEFPLSGLLGRQSPQAKMKKAWQLGISVPWIRAAERVISGSCSTVEWELEDENDECVDDDYPNAQAQRARMLLEKPQANVSIGKRLTRRELWALTFRHMGLCGNAFWYLDQRDVLAGTPDAILYVRPDRMSPNEDAAGNLLSWQLDKTPQSPGLKVELGEVVQFVLDPPDEGHFGIGLVESALLKAQLSTATDQHLAQVLSAGGRLAGIVSPKSGDALNDQQYQQLVADARTIVEQPDAAKRMQIMRGPVDFTSTVMTLQDMGAIELITKLRDDLLNLWGVPLSQVGGATPAGMNSGDTRKYDEAALWQNANHPRLVAFTESVQYGILDRWQTLGVTLELEIEEPEFDDDSPRYDLVAKSVTIMMSENERRELIGKPPISPEVLGESGGPVGEEYRLPMTQVLVMTSGPNTPTPATPSEQALGRSAAPVQTDDTGSDAVASAAGETTQGKASIRPNVRGLHTSMVKLRHAMDRSMTERMKRSVASVLEEQRREIAARAKGAAEHLMNKPGDSSVWWDGPKWDRKMRAALAPHLTGMAEQVDAHIKLALDVGPVGKAGPVGAVARALDKGATRVTALNARTRDAVIAAIRETVAAGIDVGDSPAVVGDSLEAALAGVTLDNGQPAFDEYRAEMVARTELMTAYNDAALGSYDGAGFGMVQAIDGDDDPECAERDGQEYSLDEADGIEDHPNGTLDWVPVIA